MKNVQVDEKGDFIFRFAMRRADANEPLPLDEFYRRQILDLARIVQFRFQGKPVHIDGFAFWNSPDQPISLLPSAPVEDAAE